MHRLIDRPKNKQKASGARESSRMVARGRLDANFEIIDNVSAASEFPEPEKRVNDTLTYT